VACAVGWTSAGRPSLFPAQNAKCAATNGKRRAWGLMRAGPCDAIDAAAFAARC
jgi:hypothetical protein